MRQIKLSNGSTILIRKATKSDAKAIIDYTNIIGNETDFLTFGEGEFNITIEQEENFIENTAKQNNALFIVAEIENRIIGNLTFEGGNRPRIKHAGELGVGVLKEYWGQGIGTELIKYLIEWCKNSRSIRKINLKVRSDNNSAIHVYKKLGFCQEGIVTRDFLIKDKFYDSILMGLKID